VEDDHQPTEIEKIYQILRERRLAALRRLLQANQLGNNVEMAERTGYLDGIMEAEAVLKLCVEDPEWLTRQ
jgi:hypothetical protein